MTKRIRIKNTKISKAWLYKHYIELNWTQQMCADQRKVNVSYIVDLVIDYDLHKWKFKKHKVWNIPKMKAAQKRTIREAQPHRVNVVAYKKGETDFHGVYGSISLAAKKLKTNRENIRACLHKKRKHAGGFRFEYLEDIKPIIAANTMDQIKENIQREDEYTSLKNKVRYA